MSLKAFFLCWEMVTVGNFCRGSWGYAIAEDLISTHHSCWRVGWHEELVIVAVSAEERSTWKGGGGVTSAEVDGFSCSLRSSPRSSQMRGVDMPIVIKRSVK